MRLAKGCLIYLRPVGARGSKPSFRSQIMSKGFRTRVSRIRIKVKVCFTYLKMGSGANSRRNSYSRVESRINQRVMNLDLRYFDGFRQSKCKV